MIDVSHEPPPTPTPTSELIQELGRQAAEVVAPRTDWVEELATKLAQTTELATDLDQTAELDQVPELAPDPVLPPLTDEEARRIIRRLARCDDELAALKSNYETLRRQVEDKRSFILGSESERLQLWAAEQIRGKARSVRLLEGVIGWRTNPARLVITNDTLVLEYCREHLPQAVVETVDRSRLPKAEALREHDPETGEVRYRELPGLAVVPAAEVFYVKSGVRKGTDDE